MLSEDNRTMMASRFRIKSTQKKEMLLQEGEVVLLSRKDQLLIIDEATSHCTSAK